MLDSSRAEQYATSLRKRTFKSLFLIVAETSAQLGWPADTATLYTLAALLLGPTLLYALPRTAVLGALLLIGYLGGNRRHPCGSAARFSAILCSESMWWSWAGLAYL